MCLGDLRRVREGKVIVSSLLSFISFVPQALFKASILVPGSPLTRISRATLPWIEHFLLAFMIIIALSTILLSSLVEVEHEFCPSLIATSSSNESGFADTRFQQCEQLRNKDCMCFHCIPSSSRPVMRFERCISHPGMFSLGNLFFSRLAPCKRFPYIIRSLHLFWCLFQSVILRNCHWRINSSQFCCFSSLLPAHFEV